MVVKNNRQQPNVGKITHTSIWYNTTTILTLTDCYYRYKLIIQKEPLYSNFK